MQRGVFSVFYYYSGQRLYPEALKSFQTPCPPLAWGAAGAGWTGWPRQPARIIASAFTLCRRRDRSWSLLKLGEVPASSPGGDGARGAPALCRMQVISTSGLAAQMSPHGLKGRRHEASSPQPGSAVVASSLSVTAKPGAKAILPPLAVQHHLRGGFWVQAVTRRGTQGWQMGLSPSLYQPVGDASSSAQRALKAERVRESWVSVLSQSGALPRTPPSRLIPVSGLAVLRGEGGTGPPLPTAEQLAQRFNCLQKEGRSVRWVPQPSVAARLLRRFSNCSFSVLSIGETGETARIVPARRRRGGLTLQLYSEGLLLGWCRRGGAFIDQQQPPARLRLDKSTPNLPPRVRELYRGL